jgi:hypothetical protein
MLDNANTLDPYSHKDQLINLWNQLKVDFQISDADELEPISLASVLETPVKLMRIDGLDYYVDKDRFIYRKQDVVTDSGKKPKLDFRIGIRIGQFLKN